MRWQSIFLIAWTIVLMMAFAVYGAPARTTGVNVGDWVSYSVMYEGNLTSVMGDMVNMTVATYIILDISGTNVTLQAHAYYLNGSETVETGWIDVDTGIHSGNATVAGMLIAADLEQGDLVYTTEVEPFMDGTINETITREYLGSPVIVNHYKMNMSMPPNPFYNMSLSMDWYWYKATGVPAEMSMSYVAQTTGGLAWYSWHMTVSSIIPELPAANVALAFMIAALLIVAVGGRRARSSQWMRA